MDDGAGEVVEFVVCDENFLDGVFTIVRRVGRGSVGLELEERDGICPTLSIQSLFLPLAKAPA